MNLQPFERPLAARLTAARLVCSALCLLGAVSSARAQGTTSLFSLAGRTKGRTLSALELVATPQRAGRTTGLSHASFGALRRVRRGSVVSLPLYAGKSVVGVVGTTRSDRGRLLVGGRLQGTQSGVFTLSLGGGQVGGVIEIPGQNLAFRVESGGTGAPVLQERSLSAIRCSPFPGVSQGAAAGAAAGAPAASGAVPSLNSRPDATAQVYLDFDGETVDDPLWNSNNNNQPVVMQPAGISDSEILITFNRVKEDYAPFNVNITTDVARYNAASVGRRMRCVIGVPPSNFVPNAGGVAYVNSFAQAGQSYFTSNIPCFVFSNRDGYAGRYISEAVSHEVGHTLGLSHDATSQVGYYAGHACPTGGWAPIMGVGYYENVVQWSKGEYSDANNHEDDLAIITNSANGFGYSADEAGSTPATAAQLSVSGGTINQSAVIQQTGDSDTFSFLTTGGDASVSLAGGAESPNLDAQIELLDSAGTVLQTANPADQLGASLTRTLSAGTYYFRITGVALNTPSDGYSNYDSQGAYVLSGTIPLASAPSFTVTNTSDTGDGACTAQGTGDGCSLREAIGAANVAGGTGNVDINFDPTVFAGQQTITLGTGTSLATLAVNLTINGPSSGVVVKANKVAAPVLTVPTGLTLNMTRFLMSGGQSSVRNAGTLAVTDGSFSNTLTNLVNTGQATLTNTQLSNSRTAIDNSGTLTANVCPFLNNTTGINTATGATTTVRDSTFFRSTTALLSNGTLSLGNSTLFGNTNAVKVQSGTSTIAQCTFVGNTSNAITGDGSTGATLTVNRCTICNNAVGLSTGGATTTLRNSLLVSNGTNLSGTATRAYNLINSTTNRVGIEADGNGQALLKDNGGPTLTLALLPGSSVIDRADPGISQGADQRGTGFSRVVGTSADIGAFEFQGTPPTGVPPVRGSSSPSS